LLKKRGYEAMKKYFSRDIIGGTMAFLGVAGMAEAATDHGSFIVSLAVFAVGAFLVLWGYVE